MLTLNITTDNLKVMTFITNPAFGQSVAKSLAQNLGVACVGSLPPNEAFTLTIAFGDQTISLNQTQAAQLFAQMKRQAPSPTKAKAKNKKNKKR